MSIPDTGWSLETANLPAKLKLSFSARVIMTDNISVFDWLINGSNGAGKHLDGRLTPLCDTICVKFDYPKAWKALWQVEGSCTNYCQNREVSFDERQKYCYCCKKKTFWNTWSCNYCLYVVLRIIFKVTGMDPPSGGKNYQQTLY